MNQRKLQFFSNFMRPRDHCPGNNTAFPFDWEAMIDK